MTTSTLTVADFILARIAEDEATARERERTTLMDDALEWDSDRDYGETYLMVDPARVLAQCAAMRKIVELHASGERENRAAWKDYSRWVAGKPTPSNPPARTTPEDMHGLEFAVRALASIWSDHPDWREEWA